MGLTVDFELSMPKYRFSVLLPIYHRENPDYFRSALDSIKAQTLQADEIVIVKDGELPVELDQVIEEFTDVLPIKIISIPINVGLGEALNIGINACSFELVARMDSDDVSVPERFEQQIATFSKDPQLDISGSFLQEFENEPADLKVIRRVPLKHSAIYSYTFHRCPFNHPTVMFRKDAVLKAGSYMKMPFFEDYYLWIRMALAGCRMNNSSQVLLHYRIGNNMISRRHGIKYAKHELSFFKFCYKKSLISLPQLALFSLRFPLRLIPIGMLEKFYTILLRK